MQGITSMYRMSWGSTIMPEQKSGRNRNPHGINGHTKAKEREAAEAAPKVSARQKIRNRQKEQQNEE